MSQHQPTHVIELGHSLVTKRFRSWRRDEHHREWDALKLLARYSPSLAPTPHTADLESIPPSIVMSRLPGQPLDTIVLQANHVSGLVAAFKKLHHAIPSHALKGLRPRILPPADLHCLILERANQLPAPNDPLVREVYHRGIEWLPHRKSATWDFDATTLVFAHGDAHPANYLWDGSRIYVIDFEDSGFSDQAFELATFVEHLATRLNDGIVADSFLGEFSIKPQDSGRVLDFRRMWALFWLQLLLPGQPASQRNPAGTLQLQSQHLETLLDK